MIQIYFRQLLIDCGGPEAEAVKSYFTLLGPEQASATALILATSQALVDRQVAEWSAKALLLYGGEPKLVYPAQYGAPGFPGEETNIHECKIASNLHFR